MLDQSEFFSYECCDPITHIRNLFISIETDPSREVFVYAANECPSVRLKLLFIGLLATSIVCPWATSDENIILSAFPQHSSRVATNPFHFIINFPLLTWFLSFLSVFMFFLSRSNFDEFCSLHYSAQNNQHFPPQKTWSPPFSLYQLIFHHFMFG